MKDLHVHQPLGKTLRETTDLVRRLVEMRIEASGAVFEQVRALDCIANMGVRTPSSLAKALGLSSGGMTRFLDHLSRKGWIVRERQSTNDRRVVRLSVTQAGAAAIAAAMPVVESTWADLLQDWDHDEEARLKNALDRLNAAAAGMLAKAEAAILS